MAEEETTGVGPAGRLDGDTPTAVRESALSAQAAGMLKRGTPVGRYIVLDLLGAGGMGFIYSAYDPELDRRVALKLVRAGSSSTEDTDGRARLLREAQALARLSHPNVLTVHDVGTYGQEVFLAMELVEGSDLRQWLGQGQRSWREVLGVCRQAGQGLAAAHAADLVHRDFKPENVLVGRDGRVRVVDFGLACVGSGPAAAPPAPAEALETTEVGRGPSPLSTPLTDHGALMGTPAYMAPEQILGHGCNARSDQFGFCVVFYEALCGSRPFTAQNMAALASEIMHGRIAEPCHARGVPTWLRRIVLRGLRANPEERYPSMADLLADLAKHPRRARRRWLAALAATAVLGVGALALELLLSSESGLCRGAERKLAGVWDTKSQEAVRASFLRTGKPYAQDAWKGVKRTLDTYAREWIAAHNEACEATRVRGEQSEELLDLRMQCLGERLKEVQTLTRVFSEADAMVVQRAPPATQALADIEGCADVALLKARVKPPREQAARARWEVLRTRVAEAQALRRAGKYREGRRIASGVVEEAKASGFRALEADAYKCLGSLEEGLGDLKAAEDALYRALWAAEAGRDDRVKARAAIHLGALLAKPHRRHVEANRWAEMAAAILERMRGDTPLEAALSSARGTIFHAEGRYPEALTHLERALALLHRIPEAKRDVLTTAVVYGSLGSTLSALGRHEEALLRRRQFLEMRQRHLGGAHPEVATAMVSVANSLQRLRRYEEAAAQYRQALAIQESALGPESPAAANTHNNLGALLIAQGSFEQALIHQERALAIKERFLGKKHAEVAATHNNLGEVLRAQERWEAARDHYRQALEIWSQTLGPDHPDVGVALQNLGEVSLAQHRFAEAIGYFEHALAVLEKAVGPQHPDVAFPLTGAGEASFGLGAAAKAVQLLERALRIREAARVPVGDLARTRFALARGLWKAAGDRERARLLAGQAKQGYAEAGKKHRRDLGRVEAWIARHGAR